MNVWETWFDAWMLNHLFHMHFPSFVCGKFQGECGICMYLLGSKGKPPQTQAGSYWHLLTHWLRQSDMAMEHVPLKQMIFPLKSLKPPFIDCLVRGFPMDCHVWLHRFGYPHFYVLLRPNAPSASEAWVEQRVGKRNVTNLWHRI